MTIPEGAKLLDVWFDYRPPDDDQAERYIRICAGAKQFAQLIIDTCPVGTERMLAIQRLREALFMANAAIASASESQVP